ncbi:MAG: transcription-repair coupling factor [Fusobacteriaceae bacterium]|jgi:transcription-repair coupling factor (superfamily II helicase)|nr:transcription-repair coupling factor [Fusobacteriaceae bacterium]
MKKEKIIEYRGKIPLILQEENKKIIYVCSSNRNIEDYYNYLYDFYDGKVLKVESLNEISEKDKKNYELLDILKNEKKYIILLSLEGFLRDFYQKANAEIFETGKEKKINFLEKKLINSNYEKNYLIEKRRSYSIRGNIFDIFPISGDYPVRLEFFDNILDRITYFDIETQKSIEKIKYLEMYIDSNKNNPISFLEFLGIDKDSNKMIYFENSEILAYKFEEIVLKNRDIEDVIKKRFLDLYNIGTEIEIKTFSEKELEQYRDIDELKKLAENKNIDIHLFSYEEKRYQELLSGTKIKIAKNKYFEGFKEENTKKTKLFLTDRELKGIKINKRENIKKRLRYIDVSKIKENDYIIHNNFGVGIYLGIEIIDGRDYLKIKYADEDKLFVPVENIKSIEKYVCTPGEIPEIYNLGRRGFKHKKEKLQGDMVKFAREIVEIQARREKEVGFFYSPDTIWQEEFEEGFPYKETSSQLKAINDVKKDMESGRIMDRVICGDVGYGKTEIALRAAFKAAIDRKQVAILVPTTVLAQQHYERFTERFQNYPIIIESVSRLKTAKEQKEILDKVKKGTIDILIGTHRILSEDIRFKDLGLLVIDEEQKFGVKAKERLKKIKSKVNVLTMTATPIPRTLNLSLLGIRDISIIDTPPEGRKPIDTIFIEKEDSIIKDAIMKEISREGQTFYIYNSINGVESKIMELQKYLPNYIKVDYIHGQMLPRDIKRKIRAFENGEIDVLISTTIIENGIDIENANTMIIEGIEKLGLSQIYQLRGRIGRGEKKAYCYLLNSESKSKKVKERTETIKELKKIGGGFQLSLDDMRIRGAGEILGEKQHGALETFGYNMYIKMLKEEIAKIKGEYQEDKEELEIKVLNYGYIPDTYIEKDEKIIIYKRMVEIEDEEELDELKNEIKDRFGPIPQEVIELFDYLSIKMKAENYGISAIEEKDDGYFIKFNNSKLKDINREILIKMLSDQKARHKKSQDAIIYFGELKDFFNEYEKSFMSK